MNRRSFLQALGAISAATATDWTSFLASPVPMAEPVIDWTGRFNRVVLSWAGATIKGTVNDQDVSAYPGLMKKLCGLFKFDPDAGCIRISSAGVADGITGPTGFRFMVPDLESDQTLVLGANVKSLSVSNPFVAFDMDDILVGSQFLDCNQLPRVKAEHLLVMPKTSKDWNGEFIRGSESGNGFRIDALVPTTDPVQKSINRHHVKAQYTQDTSRGRTVWVDDYAPDERQKHR